MLDTIRLKFAIGLHKLVDMIFTVSFEIIIQRPVGNESCYLLKSTLIIRILCNRSREDCFYIFYLVEKIPLPIVVDNSLCISINL
jgi:hypothetical protein